jgi:hypothetical protein
MLMANINVAWDAVSTEMIHSCWNHTKIQG